MNKTKHYLILPGCDDTNRGDQALIWETVTLAEAAGYTGLYHMLSDPEHSRQSAGRGLRPLSYVLKHPSTHFADQKNIKYTRMLTLKWAWAAFCDLIRLEPLVHPFWRNLLKKCYSPEIRQSLEIFEQADAAFVKGGGFLHAYGGFTDTYKIYYFLYHIRLALSFGTDVYVMPNSFGPFRAPLSARMTRRVLAKCKAVMSREAISQKILQEECGISSRLFTDIAFHLEGDSSLDARALLMEKGIPLGSRPCVALTMRPYRFDGESDAEQKYRNYKQSLADFIETLCKKGYHPVLVEHVSSIQEHENDMTCMEDVAHLLPPGLSYSVFSDRTLNAEQMKTVYGCFDYIVGTRFHSIIFSLASEVPAVAISYGGNKGTGIMQDLGLQEYCLPISEITSGTLTAVFEKLVRNRTEVIRHLHTERMRIRSQAEDIITLIKEA